jgi:polysaccharide pyruvyl transferase WcaK-like protein
MFKRYIDGYASALDYFAEKYGAQVVVIGMEALDYDSCHLVKTRMKTPTEVFSSKFYDGYQLAGILRALSVLVTSRYHARVISMPGGVPSIAVSMDERLHNLLSESGHVDDYYMSTDDIDLGEKLKVAMDKIWENKEKVSDEILRTIPGYLKMMSEMGQFFRKYVQEKFPGIDLCPEPADWTGYLQELHPGLKGILEKYNL